jgi:hypothetical protein
MMLLFIALLGGPLLMIGQHSRSESLFYYFRIEDPERTVSRILRSVKRPPSQTWKTLLQNYIGEIVAVDFFTVPTIRLKVHPTAAWAAQQVVPSQNVYSCSS